MCKSTNNDDLILICNAAIIDLTRIVAKIKETGTSRAVTDTLKPQLLMPIIDKDERDRLNYYGNKK